MHQPIENSRNKNKTVEDGSGGANDNGDNGGGEIPSGYVNFDVNCRDGNEASKRLQRLYYLRDGTRTECLRVGFNTGATHQFYPNTTLFAQTQPLMDEPWLVITPVVQVLDTSTFDMDAMFPMREHKGDENDLPFVQTTSVLEDNPFKVPHQINYFFGKKPKQMLNLDNTLDPKTVNNVFTKQQQYFQCMSMMYSGLCLFMLPNLTKHLGIQQPMQYLLVEVNFNLKKIVFYHTTRNRLDTLQLYARMFWFQFVLPQQETTWSIQSFLIPDMFDIQEKPTTIATIFAVSCLRLSNITVDADLFFMDLFLPRLHQRLHHFLKK